MPLVDRELLPWTATTLEREMADWLSPDDVNPDLVRDARDSHTCPVRLLPALAWDWSVDRWYPDWQESIKRQTIDSSLDLHREKGTLAAVERVLKEIGAEYTLVENPQGGHHTMLINITNTDDILARSGGQLDYDGLVDYIDEAKRLTVHHNLVARDQAGGTGLEFLVGANVTVVTGLVEVEVFS